MKLERPSIIVREGHYRAGCFIPGTIHFSPAHDYTYHVFGSTKNLAGHHPDQIIIDGAGYRFTRGLCSEVRIISDEYVMQIEQLREQLREELRAVRKRIQDTTEEAFRHGRPIKKTEAEKFKRGGDE